MEKYVYTPLMGEISGFGGSYEENCRAMVIAGLKWLDEHPGADPKFIQFKDVFGLVNPTNEEAEELEKVVIAAANGPTGAMMHGALQHILAIKAHSWDWYVIEMSKADEPATKRN